MHSEIALNMATLHHDQWLIRFLDCIDSCIYRYIGVEYEVWAISCNGFFRLRYELYPVMGSFRMRYGLYPVMGSFRLRYRLDPVMGSLD